MTILAKSSKFVTQYIGLVFFINLSKSQNGLFSSGIKKQDRIRPGKGRYMLRLRFWPGSLLLFSAAGRETFDNLFIKL